ncbi:MAG TPA: GNAT family N-acetyltransferase [Lacipirellulaceae bacterium]
MVEVIEVNDIDELSQYRLLWNSLFAATPRASFFLTLDWLEAYWRHFGRDQKLNVLIVYAAGQPIGILPLCVRSEQYRLNKVRVLTYPLDDCGTWYGPIGPNPASTMLAAMQHIRRTPRDWDMIELRWVSDDGTHGGRTARALRVAGMFTEKQPYQTTSILELPENWDEFVSAKSRSVRHQFRRQLRHAFEEANAEYVRHRPAPATEGDGDPRWDLYAMCEETAASSWQSSVTNGNTLSHDRVRNYYRDAHAAAARLGMVDVNVLMFEGRPAAFLYNYVCDSRISALRTGFDASLANHGFGSALALRFIQDSMARGDTFVDFGQGEREHKRRLRTRAESTYRLTYTPLGSWRSQTVRLTRWAKNRLSRTKPASATAEAASA